MSAKIETVSLTDAELVELERRFAANQKLQARIAAVHPGQRMSWQEFKSSHK